MKPKGIHLVRQSLDSAHGFVLDRLTLRHLRLLLALAAHGSLSRAAESMSLTQPAVSKGLREIEQGLGETLFVRRRRNMTATPVAERLLLAARQMQTQLERAASDVQALVNGSTGVVRIGASNAAMARLVPMSITRMKAEQPGLQITVRSHDMGMMLQELRRGELDVVLARPVGTKATAGLDAHRLGPHPERLVISVMNPLSRATRVSLEVLANEPWLVPIAGTRSRDLLDRLWRTHGLPPPRNVIETPHPMLKIDLLRRMPLVATLPQDMALMEARRATLRLLPLDLLADMEDMTAWTVPGSEGRALTQYLAHLHAVALEPPE